MKWVKSFLSDCVPIKSWCDPIEDGALEQAINLSEHPAVYKHIALMPDCHQGYGMPIGGVIACKNAVIPNAVGVDIGCGMSAIQTHYEAEYIEIEDVKEIMGAIRKVIPAGFAHNKENQAWGGFDSAPDIPIINQELKSARKQLGTLGGGNHFIEIQKGSDGYIWLMLHSGSRNFGFKIANFFHKKALELCEKWHSELPDEELAFLPIGTQEASDYITAMNFALAFAKTNREIMQDRSERCVSDILSCTFGEQINIHHNYAAIEHHFNKNVYIHRKGAISAMKGEKGIIPGSMGTPSYIVEGLGNPEGFMSCSHGAGRCMGRKAASRNLTEAECTQAMEGIVFGRWGKDRKGKIDLGEAPQAYKNIDTVISAQLDLIKVLVKLEPLGVIKA